MPENGVEEKKRARWYLHLLGKALEESADLAEAVQVADAALEMEPVPQEKWIHRILKNVPSIEAEALPFDASLAHDVFSKREQGIRNRALEKAKKLSSATLKELRAALSLKDQGAMARAVVTLIQKHRIELARVLSTAQLAAVLEGFKTIADKLPAMPSVPFPTTLPPEEAKRLVDRLKMLSPAQQAQEV